MKLALIVIVAIIAFVCSTSASVSLQGEQYQRYVPEDHNTIQTKNSEKAAVRYRLPKDVVPEHYVLHIKPRLFRDDSNPESLRVPGNVEITVRCVTATNKITLHAAELDITLSSITVTRVDPAQALTVTTVSFNDDAEVQTVTLELGQSLEVNSEYKVYMDFKSRIALAEERMNGIYLSTYLDGTTTKLIATTQFSRTRSVRKVFPSFDEPSQKATFQINIGRTDDSHTLSCMELTNGDTAEPIEGEDGWFWDRYAVTPKMPITVIAFIISDFDSYKSTLSPTKSVSTWVPPPMLRDNGAVFSADTAAKILLHYETLFDIPYELPKLDSAGMPDFAAGAMENWGLNIYRTTYMLYYKDETPIATKYQSANVIGHEVAHQWFGNLVTHAWWNDWWITEGFASYFEYIGSNHAAPEFDQLDRIVCDDIQPAMAFDIGPDSVPIHGKDAENFVENPSTINYSKGASLVRMMNAFLTPEVFIPALQDYLKKRSYTAIDQYALFDDLTDSLGENLPNGKSMREIMDSWTLQTGFPLIRVTKASANSIYLTQELFQAYGSQKKEGSGLFHVPISYATKASPAFDGTNVAPKFWFDDATVLKSLAVDTNQWMVFNVDAHGYYRVIYDTHFEGLLKAQLILDPEVISVASRSQILDDYFAAAFERYLPIARALDLTAYLSKETGYVAWSTVFRQLRKFTNLVLSTGTENVEAFQLYMRTQLQGAIQHLGLEQVADEDGSRTIFRVQVLDWACTMKDEACLARSKGLVEEWAENAGTNPIPVDVRATTYCSAVASEDAAIWTFIETQYSQTNVAELRNALACTNNQAKLTNLLNAAITTGSQIPKQDAVALIQRIAMNTVGRPLVVDLLDTKTKEIVDYIGNSDSISTIVLTLRDYITSTDERNKIEGLITKYDASLTEPVKVLLRQYVNTITSNIDWMGHFGEQMSSWFKDAAAQEQQY